MGKIAPMKRVMQQRVVHLSDVVNAEEEKHLMLKEETRSYHALTYDASRRCKTDQHIEWLEKLVKATRIQHLDAERKLSELQATGQQQQRQAQPHNISN